MTAILFISIESGHQRPEPGSTPDHITWYFGCGGLNYEPRPVPAPAFGGEE